MTEEKNTEKAEISIFDPADPQAQDDAMEAKLRAQELTSLKERASSLGLTFSNNIGADTLRERIKEHMESLEKPKAESTKDPVEDDSVDQNTLPLAAVTDPAVIRRRLYEENMKLVRVRISNLNPAKKDLPGEILTVTNKYIGTVSKYIPFGEATDNGYHVPNILLKALRNRKYVSLKPRRDKKTGTGVPEQRWANEFAIEVLPPLTRKELEQLARQQAAAKGL